MLMSLSSGWHHHVAAKRLDRVDRVGNPERISEPVKIPNRKRAVV
jgi:hypothetical protein